MKYRNLFIGMASVVFLLSCGAGQKNNTEKELKVPAKTVNDKLEVLVTLGDQTLKFKDADIQNNAATPGQKSDDYTIYAGATDDGMSVFSLDFTKIEGAGATDPFLTIKGYKIDNISIVVDDFTTKKGTYGGVGVTKIKGMFTGQARKLDANGFPEGEPFEFNGSFEK